MEYHRLNKIITFFFFATVISGVTFFVAFINSFLSGDDTPPNELPTEITEPDLPATPQPSPTQVVEDETATGDIVVPDTTPSPPVDIQDDVLPPDL